MTSVTFDATTFQAAITNFSKSLTYTPVTKTTHSITGDETLTDGNANTISGCLFRREDDWKYAKEGLLQNADAILLVLPSVTINKNDKVAYDSETYRLDKVTTRRLGNTSFYKVSQLFKVI